MTITLQPVSDRLRSSGRSDTLRVAFVTAFPRDPDRPCGGIESVSVVLVDALSRLPNMDIEVVTTDAECLHERTNAWNGMTVHRLPRRGHTTLTDAIYSSRRTVSEYLRSLRPDVVHAHDVFGLMVKGLTLPRVFTVHGFIHGDTLVSGSRFALARAVLWRWIEESGWADQPHIISISPYVRERLTGVARGVIHDIDNPIAPDFFDVPRAEESGTIFSAALICPRKNPLALVEAVGRLARNGVEARLHLAGAICDETYGRRLRERIEQLKRADRVTLLGSISGQNVRDELSRASLIALVSLEEGSPLGIEEAMAAGVPPVVTSNRCGMPYMVRDGESGFLVDPLDVDDVAWRLGQILTDDGLRARMGATSRRIALDRFTPTG